MIGSQRPVTFGPTETPLSLLERLRQCPDNPSWHRLTELYLPLILRWLNQHGLPLADADDLSQDILLVILRSRGLISTITHASSVWR